METSEMMTILSVVIGAQTLFLLAVIGMLSAWVMRALNHLREDLKEYKKSTDAGFEKVHLAIGELRKDVAVLGEKVGVLSEKVGGVSKRVDEVGKRFHGYAVSNEHRQTRVETRVERLEQVRRPRGAYKPAQVGVREKD